MKIVVDINHPAHVHFFKNFIWEMEKRGHQVVITASKKDLAYTLLQKYGFTYIPVGSYGNSLLKKMINLPLLDLKMYNVLRKINPDILIGIGSIRAAHVSFLLKKPCISFEDTEHARGQIRLYLPFAATVCTPSCYRDDLGPKQIRYHGYHELAYLHPSRFTPNPSVLAELGLAEGDPYIIVRFVSWQASHDIGQHGIHDKVGLVKMLEKYGRVLITSEGALPEELQAYQIRISPEKMHDLLYYATLYVGEGATMASECAILGTHAIYVNSLDLGYIAEEDEKYHLVADFAQRVCTDETVFVEIKNFFENGDLKHEAKQNRDRLLKDKIDITAFMIWLVEHYPESITQMKKDPTFQEKFGSP